VAEYQWILSWLTGMSGRSGSFIDGKLIGVFRSNS
jgi:hypothetical protein